MCIDRGGGALLSRVYEAIAIYGSGEEQIRRRRISRRDSILALHPEAV